MTRYHRNSKGRVAFTQAEEDERDLEETAQELDAPQREWKLKLQEHESLVSSHIEDLYNALPDDSKRNVSADLKKLIAEKQDHRDLDPSGGALEMPT